MGDTMVDDPNGAVNADEPPTREDREVEIPVESQDARPLDGHEPPPATEEDDDGAEEAAAEGAVAPEATEETRRQPPKLPKWAQDKMASMAAAEREAKREAKRLAEELERRQSAPPVNAEDEAAARSNGPDPGAQFAGHRSQAEFDAAVRAEADRREAARLQAQTQAAFDASCNKAYTEGKEKFADHFDAAVQNLQAVGAMNRDVLDLILETDDPATVIYELGSDPDKAASIVALSPQRRAIEIAKLAVTPLPRPTPANVSKAPPPVRPVEGTARVTPDPRDDDDDPTWFAKRARQIGYR